MPEYSYTARDRNGNDMAGNIFAENDAELRDMLRVNDLFLTKYEKKSRSALAGEQQRLFRSRRVKLDDMVVMSRQLATLVRAGLPIVKSLGTVAAQTDNPILAEALREVRITIIGGSSLAEAMRHHPKIFSELYCSLVEAGEVGGVLDQTLDLAATQFDKEAVLKQQINTAMAYPILVIVAACGVVAFMLLFIVPMFSKVYLQFHAELPALTKLLVSISQWAVHFWYLFPLVPIVLIVSYKKYRSTPNGRLATDRFYLTMPIFGKVVRKVAISRFTQTFGSAMHGGIPILRALAISANTSGNHVIRDAVMRVASHVQEGTSLALPLEDTGEFPPMVTRMIAAGETSGNLGLMLDEVTKFYERDVEYSVQKLTRLMEPVMTVFVGAIVLFVVLALYMPIFNLANVIKR